MTSTPNIQLTQQADGIVIVTINRGAQFNALSTATMLELESILQKVIGDKQIRALLITGAGEKAFVAGADINEFTQLQPVESKAFAERGQRILQMIEELPIPVVAAVNGFALGGGCELALACHIRVASEKAQLGLPEVKLGIIPGYGGTQRLTRLVGQGKALEMMLTGNPISAHDALRIGLVNHVVPAEELIPFTLNLMGHMMARAPFALTKVLEAVRAAQNNPQQGYAIEAEAFEACCHTSDFREGVTAFLEKRTPNFQGS